MAEELWDAYDKDGKRLASSLVRGQAIPHGVYHLVVEVYTVTADKKILLTKRHPDKAWPGKWETTGGSVLQGETAAQGAARELLEETGIHVPASQLRLVYHTLLGSSLYYCYMANVNEPDVEPKMQPGETVDWQFIAYADFKKFILTDDFVPPLRDRFLARQALFDELIQERKGDGD